MSTYRVVYETKVEADTPLDAVLLVEQMPRPNPLVYSDTYRVVTEIDRSTGTVVYDETTERREPDW